MDSKPRLSSFFCISLEGALHPGWSPLVAKVLILYDTLSYCTILDIRFHYTVSCSITLYLTFGESGCGLRVLYMSPEDGFPCFSGSDLRTTASGLIASTGSQV